MQFGNFFGKKEEEAPPPAPKGRGAPKPKGAFYDDEVDTVSRVRPAARRGRASIFYALALPYSHAHLLEFKAGSL